MSPKPRNRLALFLLCLTVALALGVMATLIHAQGDPLAATPLRYNETLPGTLSFTSPRVAYAFAGEQNDLVTVRVSPLASGVDPKVTLLDPSGQILMQNDNGAFSGKPDSFLSLFLPQSGFYTVIVEPASSATGDFLIELTGRAPVKSHRLEFGVPVEVDVRTDPLPVYFTFKADADCPTTLTVYDISAGKPYTFPFVVIVRDEDGTPVEQLQGGRMTENRMTVHNQPDTSPTAGLYEVEVTSADPTVAGSLFLVVTCADQEPACFVPPGLVGTPTPETPTPPPPTVDPCDLSEITIDGPDGPIVISGQDGSRGGGPIHQLGSDGGSGDRGGGPIRQLGEDTLTPSPTMTISATPCATPTPPCLSAAQEASTALAATSQALVATWAAGGVSQSDQQATVTAYIATINAIKTQVALNPEPCEPPTVTPCPTNDRAQLITASGATELAQTQIAAGCATPTCPPPDRNAIQVVEDATATAVAYALGCGTPHPTRTPTPTPTCLPTPVGAVVPCNPHPTRTPTPTPDCTPAAATVAVVPCQSLPTRTPDCGPTPAGAIIPCEPTLTPVPDCTPTAAALLVVPCATPTCPPSPAGAIIPCNPTPTPDCTPARTLIAGAQPCQPPATLTCPPPGTPDRTRLSDAANPCATPSGCPTPGVGGIVPENPNQAGGATPSGDLGILVLPTPCVTPTATPSPTATRRPNVPQTVDCGNFVLTSPTDGLPNGGITVYWNPAPGATGYRVNVYNDANQLKLSVTVAGNVTSVGIDVSEGSVGPGYTFTLQVQALYNGRVGCTSAKTENRAARPNGGDNGDNGDKPKPTCPPFTAAGLPCQ